MCSKLRNQPFVCVCDHLWSPTQTKMAALPQAAIFVFSGSFSRTSLTVLSLWCQTLTVWPLTSVLPICLWFCSWLVRGCRAVRRWAGGRGAGGPGAGAARPAWGPSVESVTSVRTWRSSEGPAGWSSPASWGSAQRWDTHTHGSHSGWLTGVSVFLFFFKWSLKGSFCFIHTPVLQHVNTDWNTLNIISQDGKRMSRWAGLDTFACRANTHFISQSAHFSWKPPFACINKTLTTVTHTHTHTHTQWGELTQTLNSVLLWQIKDLPTIRLMTQ